MSGGIYLIQDNGQLIEMTEQAYDSEDLLQGLLADYPNLLAGDQIDSAAPRRWLLIAREMGLPSEGDGADRWAVDHLFLDQDAIPTLVEVKRSADTRIRREVVGQMLDYAANAVVHWPVETIRAQFKSNCKNIGPEDVLNEFLGPNADQDAFWQKVKTNLQEGRVRLIFVADEIPPELRRIVEFLNAQMDPAEVLAVEIKQYVGKGLKTLVPRVIGQTGEPPMPPRPSWDEVSFFQALGQERDVDEIAVARKIFEWIKTSMPPVGWGKGKEDGAFRASVRHREGTSSLVSVWTTGDVQVDAVTIPPFQDKTKRLEFLRRLNVDVPPGKVFPNIELSALKDDKALKQLFDTLDWAVQEIKAS